MTMATKNALPLLPHNVLKLPIRCKAVCRRFVLLGHISKKMRLRARPRAAASSARRSAQARLVTTVPRRDFRAPSPRTSSHGRAVRRTIAPFRARAPRSSPPRSRPSISKLPSRGMLDERRLFPSVASVRPLTPPQRRLSCARQLRPPFCARCARSCDSNRKDPLRTCLPWARPSRWTRAGSKLSPLPWPLAATTGVFSCRPRGNSSSIDPLCSSSSTQRRASSSSADASWRFSPRVAHRAVKHSLFHGSGE